MAKRVRKAKIRKPYKARIKRKGSKRVYKPGTSKIEGVFGKFLRLECGLKIEKQYQIAYKFYDFKIKDTMILIEFDGDLWHCNPTAFKEGAINQVQRDAIINDKYKDELARSCGYRLLRIWEKDFRTNKYLVKNKILDFVNNKNI